MAQPEDFEHDIKNDKSAGQAVGRDSELLDQASLQAVVEDFEDAVRAAVSTEVYDSEVSDSLHENSDQGGAREASEIETQEGEDFRPRLASFQGPLDLLLYLIHKNEVDIFDIPISRILDQYLGHVRDLQSKNALSLDDAGEFLLMTARLMEIKSRMLLPSDGVEEEEDLLDVEVNDPRSSLVHQLLEYQQNKERATALEDLFNRRSQQYDRPLVDGIPPPPDTLDLSKSTLPDLTTALLKMLREADARDRVAVIKNDDIPIEVVMDEIVATISANPEILFYELFDPSKGRRVLIQYFLALLELCKVHRLIVLQPEAFGEIRLSIREDPEDSAPTAEDYDNIGEDSKIAFGGEVGADH